MSKQTEELKLALNKAFQLGKRYWSWADSEYSSHWKKADAAKAEFDQLVQDTINAALAEQPAQQEIDWKDQYEKQKRRADMWVAKYEADIGPLEKAGPVTAQQEPVAVVSGYYGGQCVILPIDPARIYNSNTPLYTSPPPCPTCEALARTVMLDQTSHDAQRKPLSLQERTKIVRANKSFHDKDEIDAYGVIDDVEAAHGITGEKK